jgi:hypothetical protein
MLCCEGSCSPGLNKFYEKIPTLESMRFPRSTVRGVESATLTHTPHYFVRAGQRGETVYHTWACTVCGNERLYGAEYL